MYTHLSKLASLTLDGWTNNSYLPQEKAYISLYKLLRLDKEIEEDLRKDKLLMSP